MNRNWPSDALDFERSARRAFAESGGVDATRICEVDPALRVSKALPVLQMLGLLELDPWASESESAAAMLGSRAAGSAVWAWPVAQQLAVPSEVRHSVGGVFLLPSGATKASHADALVNGVVVDPETLSARRAVVVGGLDHARLDPFSVGIDQGHEVDGIGVESVKMLAVVEAFYVSGALRTVVSQVADYSQQRVQFGTQIAKFGEVRWRLADMVVALSGLDEIAMHTWWLARRGEATLADAFAVRLKMLEAAGEVLHHGHQVLAAIGLCEEHDLAVIDRHLQSPLHRPGGKLYTTRLLARAVVREGFDATFPVAVRG